jgi:hypothetical protein
MIWRARPVTIPFGGAGSARLRKIPMTKRRLSMIVCSAVAWVAVAAAASVAGTWAFVMDTPGGDRFATVILKVDGDKVTGTWDDQPVEGVFKDGQLTLAFPFTSSENQHKDVLKVAGALEADALTGEWTFGEYGGRFKASRKP